MIKVKLHNDGKGKYQSYEMYLDSRHALYGYGKDEAEAKEGLKASIDAAIVELQNLDLDNPEIVDYKGDPIKS